MSRETAAMHAQPERTPRESAYLRAYHLLEAVQGDPRTRAEAVAALPTALREADTLGWNDVAFVVAGAVVVHSMTRGDSRAQTKREIDALVARAQRLGTPTSMAVALAYRAAAAANSNDTGTVLADGARAAALLDDASDDDRSSDIDKHTELERAIGYVAVAAAFNSLRLWELVDDFYGRVIALGDAARVAQQTAAVAVNRVIMRLEWALALLESGDDRAARQQLAQVLDVVDAAASEPMPNLWRRDVLAGADVAKLLRGDDIDEILPRVERHRHALSLSGDLELLPKLEAATALALWRAGRRDEALARVANLERETSNSSGAHSFPLWVRATVLAEAEPSAATAAQIEYVKQVCHMLSHSRAAVLAAARAQIGVERRKREHEALTRAVDTDPLTGLRNRRAFEAWLRRPLEGSAANTALLLIDIDNFKEVNDTFGHDRGDEVLRAVASMMVSSVRPGDLAVRHGGDEFALILEGDPVLETVATHRANELGRAIETASWHDIAPGLSVSVSIGVAVARPHSDASAAVDPARLYKLADEALYRSKQFYRAKQAPSRVEVVTL